MKKSVSIIIPNYNGKSLLKEYLPYTINAINNAQTDYEIIIVDDASKDDSVIFIKTHYPNIILLQNTVNKGFSATCNVGIAKASKELMLILNSDIKLNPDYFENQWQYFTDKNTFGVMGKINDINPKVKDGPKLITNKGLKFKFHQIFSVKDKNKWTPTSFISGANALICSKKMKQIGGFNEIFSPFYYEDTDLSIRAWRLGWKCYYDFKSECTHLGSSTINANHLKKSIKIIFYRNRYLLHGLHLNSTQFLLFKIQTLCLEIIPKSLIGRFWIWKSFISLSKYHKQIQQSQQNLEKQSEHTGTLIPIFGIRKKVIKVLAASEK